MAHTCSGQKGVKSAKRLVLLKTLRVGIGSERKVVKQDLRI